MTPRQRAVLSRAVFAFGDAQFACGEWDSDESDEPYEVLHARAERAEARLKRLIGLVPAEARTLASDLAEDR